MKTVLIVEGNANSGKLLVELIRHITPYQLILPYNGTQALEIVCNVFPALKIARDVRDSEADAAASLVQMPYSRGD
jgi:hypothetical protein